MYFKGNATLFDFVFLYNGDILCWRSLPSPIALLLPIVERSIVMTVSVCLSVCMSVRVSLREHISGTTHPIFAKCYVRVMSMSVVWSSSGSIAIRYVFPVLQMMSYLHISQGCSTSRLTERSTCAALGWAINGAQ